MDLLFGSAQGSGYSRHFSAVSVLPVASFSRRSQDQVPTEIETLPGHEVSTCNLSSCQTWKFHELIAYTYIYYNLYTTMYMDIYVYMCIYKICQIISYHVISYQIISDHVICHISHHLSYIMYHIPYAMLGTWTLWAIYSIGVLESFFLR